MSVLAIRRIVVFSASSSGKTKLEHWYINKLFAPLFSALLLTGLAPKQGANEPTKTDQVVNCLADREQLQCCRLLHIVLAHSRAERNH